MKGAGAIVIALNVAYEVPEERSFLRVTLVNAAVTIGAIAVAGLASESVFAALGHSAAGLSPLVATAIKIIARIAADDGRVRRRDVWVQALC